MLVQYALEHHVTRIVLGHSKQTRPQEMRQGSLLQDLLKKARGIDIFIVADRAAHDGERIIPAQINPRRVSSDSFHRLNEQELDRKMEQVKRGRFKVYIGAPRAWARRMRSCAKAMIC